MLRNGWLVCSLSIALAVSATAPAFADSGSTSKHKRHWSQHAPWEPSYQVSGNGRDWRDYRWSNFGKHDPWAKRKSKGWYGYPYNRSYGSYGYYDRYDDDYYPRHKRRNNFSKTDAAVLGVVIGAVGLAALAGATKKKRNKMNEFEDGRYRNWENPDTEATLAQRSRPDEGGDCLQLREYQTTVIIGGRERPAYGMACLKADGSWMQGPATVEGE
jgi:surface antigen